MKKVLKFILFRIIIPSLIVAILVFLMEYFLLVNPWNKLEKQIIIASIEASVLFVISFYNLFLFMGKKSDSSYKIIEDYEIKINKSFDLLELKNLKKALQDYKTSSKCFSIYHMKEANRVLSKAVGKIQVLMHEK